MIESRKFVAIAILMGIALSLQVLAYLVIKKIVNIEV